jgi:hypothetical protein
MKPKSHIYWSLFSLLFFVISGVAATDMCEVVVNVPTKPWRIRMSIPRDYGLSDPTDPRSPTYGQKNLLMRAQWPTGDVLTLVCVELPSGVSCESLAKGYLSEMTKVKGVDPNTLDRTMNPRYALYTYVDSYGLRKYWSAFFSYSDNCIHLTISKPKARWDDSQEPAAIIESLSFVE